MGRKTTVWILQETNCRDCTGEDIKIETEFLLTATENNAIRAN